MYYYFDIRQGQKIAREDNASSFPHLFLQEMQYRHLEMVPMLEFGNPNLQLNPLQQSLASPRGLKTEPVTHWTHSQTWTNWALMVTRYITSVGPYR